MKSVRNGLGLALGGVFVLRLVLWLVTPLIPILAVGFLLAAIAVVVVGRRQRL